MLYLVSGSVSETEYMVDGSKSYDTIVNKKR